MNPIAEIRLSALKPPSLTVHIFSLYTVLILIITAAGLFVCLPELFHRDCLLYSTKDIIPILVSLGFWITAIIAMKTHRPVAETVSFLAGSSAITTAILTNFNYEVGSNLFYVHLAILTPFVLHFHLSILLRPLRGIERMALSVFYLLATLLSFPFLFALVQPEMPFIDYSVLRTAIRVLFFIAYLVAICLLIISYRFHSTLASKRRTRLITLGFVFSFTPITLLTLLPQTLGLPYLTELATFPWLLMIPLVYFYAVFRSRLSNAENILRNTLVYYLLITLSLSGFIIVSYFIRQSLSSTNESLVVTVLVWGTLLLIYNPLRKLMYTLVDWAFYGSETNYISALKYLQKSLANVLDRKLLVQLLLNELVTIIQPAHAALYILQNDHLHLAGTSGFSQNEVLPPQLPAQGLVAHHLTTVKKPVEAFRLINLPEAALSGEEKKLLGQECIALYIPLISEGTLQGLILFDFRVGDDLFSQADLILLGEIVDQAGHAIRNVKMAENFKAGQEELTRAHQMLLDSQEQERKRIARELHDDTVQQLLGISYQVVDLRKRLGLEYTHATGNLAPLLEDVETVRKGLLDIVTNLREVIGELRPAGLDELGLPFAIEGYVENLSKMNGDQLKFDVQIDPQITHLPEMVSICIFRVTQEALRNAAKHASASTVFLRLYSAQNEVILKVMDDGKGFQVPDRLSELSQQQHFGLMGIVERVHHVGGEVTITSEPEQGCSITARFPLKG